MKTLEIHEDLQRSQGGIHNYSSYLKIAIEYQTKQQRYSVIVLSPYVSSYVKY